MTSTVEQGLADTAALLEWLRDTERAERAVERLAERLATGFTRGGRVLACGNGGSMCDAMHFAEELSARFRLARPALAAQAISDPAHLTCVGNDEGFERIFARGVEAWGRPGDTLVVFSTSGNSPNVIAAVETARSMGLDTVGLLGRDGGTLKSTCATSIVVPGKTSDRIQEVHITIVHLLIELIERRLFP